MLQQRVLSEADARSFLDNPKAYPGLPARLSATEEFRLSRQPAFDPEASWFLLFEQGSWFIRRIVYAPAADVQSGIAALQHHRDGPATVTKALWQKAFFKACKRV